MYVYRFSMIYFGTYNLYVVDDLLCMKRTIYIRYGYMYVCCVYVYAINYNMGYKHVLK